VLYAARPQNFGVFVTSLDSPANATALGAYGAAAYVSPGYLLLLKGESNASVGMTLLAQPFDPASLKPTGTPQAIADRVQFDTLLALGYVRASATGALVYGNVERRATRLTWLDRSGKELGLVGSSGDFAQPTLAPDEKTIAVQRNDPNAQDSDLWLIDAVSGS